MISKKLCTRKVDELGRIVLPMEAREALGAGEKQGFDIFLEKGSIVLKPNHDVPFCKLCGKGDAKLVEIGTSLVCVDCIAKVCLVNIKSN